MDFQQSQTFINLQALYEYQLKASGEYEIFSIKARQETLIEIANSFDLISKNERTIAEKLRRLLLNGETNTLQNLLESRDEELVANSIYQEYSSIAREEGYDDIASLFNGIANIKSNHSLTFQTFASNIENNEVFCKKEESLWICIACGNIMSGICAPRLCPICQYPQGFYQILRY